MKAMAFAAAFVWASSGEAQPVNPPQLQAAFTHFEFLSAIIDSLSQSHVAIMAVNRKANDPRKSAVKEIDHA